MPIMAYRFKNIDCNTPMPMPPDLRDWVAEELDALASVVPTVSGGKQEIN